MATVKFRCEIYTTTLDSKTNMIATPCNFDTCIGMLADDSTRPVLTLDPVFDASVGEAMVGTLPVDETADTTVGRFVRLTLLDRPIGVYDFPFQAKR